MANIIAHLAPSIDRKVDLNNPDKIVWIDLLGCHTAIAVLKPEEIFSVILE
jgi:tRNA(Ser,Leu) C12 N-acetylase TAN1